VDTERIDFISCYCDRWCERCAYTLRCSLYACEIATAMCGDFAEGLELAVGRPHPVDPVDPVDNDAQEADLSPFAGAFDNVEMSPQERAEFDRDEGARDARIEALPASTMSHAYAMVSHRWLQERDEGLRARADPVLAEAFDVVTHDSALVTVKVHRALDGRDRYQHDRDGEDDPVQNDWNGSAKVALISLQRSEVAWRVIAQATSDERALALADGARDLGRVVQNEFPRAMSFIRPGFDEPWR